MDIKKIIQEQIQKKILEEDHLNSMQELQQGLGGVISEVCRCLSNFNAYEFVSNNPEQARRLYHMLEEIQNICANAPISKSDVTPDLLRR